MSRLIDDAVAYGIDVTIEAQAIFDSPHDCFRTIDDHVMRHGPVFAIHNVADYFFSLPDDKIKWQVGFPNLAPPFQKWWMEYSLPSSWKNTESGIQAIGTSWIATEIADETLAQEVYADLKTAVADAIQGEGRTFWERSGERIRWVVEGIQFARVIGKKKLEGPLLRSQYYIGERGSLVCSPVHFAAAIIRDSEAHQNYIDCFTTFQKVSLLAVCFLNCKNVKAVKQIPDERTERRFKERFGTQMVRWHTLVIEPMKRALTESGAGESGIQKALHICRGHFKDYREAGLFGKLKGMYWWDAHVRGTIAAGVAPKDYAVKAPSPEVR